MAEVTITLQVRLWCEDCLWTRRCYPAIEANGVCTWTCAVCHRRILVTPHSQVLPPHAVPQFSLHYALGRKSDWWKR